MIAMQSLGYNGFKRWHRLRSKQFFDLKCKLSTELFDKFRKKATFKDYELNYSPDTMESHLKAWDNSLLQAIEDLGTLNNQFAELTGMCCDVIDCATKYMMKDFEKVGRYYKRFTESDWLTLDMHIVDDKLHKKFKMKEKKHGYKK
jgi:hypothetical protein